MQGIKALNRADGNTDPTLDLVAAVIRQALMDAKQNHPSAILFLDQVLPEWRQLDQKYGRRRGKYGSRTQLDQ